MGEPQSIAISCRKPRIGWKRTQDSDFRIAELLLQQLHARALAVALPLRFVPVCTIGSFFDVNDLSIANTKIASCSALRKERDKQRFSSPFNDAQKRHGSCKCDGARSYLNLMISTAALPFGWHQMLAR